MREFRDKVAVVTGGASGIGRAMACRCATLGMNVVLADIEREALAATAVELRAGGAPVLAVLTDVSKLSDVERLARKTIDRFGAVHLLFNNAGVATVGPRLWEGTPADWTWILGVNLMGVLHGVRVFVPIMLDLGASGHIVNTTSSAGLTPLPGMGIYSAGKAAIVALTETLHHELTRSGAAIGVSLLCPGLVNTRMMDSARTRSPTLQNDPATEEHRRTAHAAERESLRKAIEEAMAADELAERVFEAIREERFYVFGERWVKELFRARAENLLRERDPCPPSRLEELAG